MISAVIPVHDRFEFLNETLASVFAQTRIPDEVLIVDDCSAIPVEEYLARNPPPGPVRIVHTGHSRNAGGARNFGWRHAQGDLIAFNDSDDLWEPDKIRLQAEYLDSHPEADGVYGPMEAFFPGGRTQPWAHDRPLQVDVPSALLDANMTIQTLMMRRKALEVLGGFDETLAILEDQAFSIEIGLAGLHVVFLPSPLVTRYRRNDLNISRNAVQYLICDCRVAIRYRRLSAEVFGAGSVRIHLSRAIRRFGVKKRGLGLFARVLGSLLESSAPSSKMPRWR
ncbi:MAG TPA: glycosyltransferase family A protein [Terracidiphilus sp.]